MRDTQAKLRKAPVKSEESRVNNKWSLIYGKKEKKTDYQEKKKT